MTCRRMSRVALTAAALTVLLSMLLSASALADGSRRIELEAQTGSPEAGVTSTLLVRFLEGDHGVEKANVLIVAGMGGSHDEHSLGGSPAGTAAPFEVIAQPGPVEGEYLAEVVFSQAGNWTVWVTAEKGGKITEQSFEVPVAEAAPSAIDPVDEATGTGSPSVAGSAENSSADPAGEEASVGEAAPLPDEHADMSEEEMAGHGGLSIEPEGDSHAEGEADSHGGAGGEINWVVIGGFLAVIGLGIAAANLLKRRLREQMALGNLKAAGAVDE